MKNAYRKPYIYKVTNLETHQYYIGSQCIGKTVGVNYFTSSTNKEFWEDFKTYGEEKYKITRVKEFEDPDECVRAENYMIRDHMLLKDGLCLNRACCCNGEKIFSRVGTHGWNKGIPRSEEAKKKMSRALKGRPSPKKGIPLSEEHKKKLSLAKKGQRAPNKGIPMSEEHKKKLSLAHKGIPLSEETKHKISTSLKGTHHSEETKQKIGLASKGRPSSRRINISIGDNTFDSLNEASKYYNVGRATISRWLKTGNHNAFYIEK